MWFCRKLQFWGQNPTIEDQKFNDLHTPKRSKKQICDRTTASRQETGRHTSGPERTPGSASVCVCVDTLSLTPLLRYDGRMDHALSPIPDARDAHALQRHVGDRAVLAE